MILRLLCRMPGMFFWFHHTEIIQTFDAQTRKLRCVDCNQYFAMSDVHQAVLPWDKEYEEITCLIYGLSRTNI